MSVPPDDKQPVSVPPWVAVVTFLLCWGLGGYLLIAESRAGTSHTGLLFVAVLLLLFPLLSFQGLIPVLLSIIRRFGAKEEE